MNKKILWSLLLLTLIGFGIGQQWWKHSISPTDNVSSEASNETVQFHVPAGTAGQQVGNQLFQAGLIRSTVAWKLWTRWQLQQDPDGGFKSGTYLLSPQDDMGAIAKKIWQGEVMQTSFTIPEGWTIEQMAAYFESIGYFEATEFEAAAENIPYDQYPWLPPDLTSLEGFLYPDTYKISSDRLNPEAIIEVMLDQFETDALPIYQEAKNQTDLSLMDWVTLGSIVEKEAVVPDERGIIAGVFANRLRIGMALQSDPTVEYGLGIKQTADRPLTYEEVATPNPYNTYINPGLPPTPIANPGKASLYATLHPESTDYIYFVARYDGTHIFSKSLSQHNRAVNQIRRQRQTQNN